MNQLHKAIIDRMNDASPEAVAFKNSIDGRLRTNAAKQNEEFPYVVQTIINDANLETFNTQMDDVLIQFQVFSKQTSSQEVGNIRDLLTDVYDNTVLPIDDYTFIVMQRDVSNLLREPDDAWQYNIQYRIMIQK